MKRIATRFKPFAPRAPEISVRERPRLRLAHLHLEGIVKQALDTARTRLMFSAGLFILAFLAIGARLVDVTLLRQGTEPRVATSEQSGPLRMDRADITDRNGVLLATNLETASLYANPRQIAKPVEAARQIAGVLPDLSADELTAHLSAHRSFVWIKRNLTPKQEYEVNRLGIPGLYFQREERRIYPQGALMSHVVGFSDIDNKGLAGVEESFDKRLRDDSAPLRLSLDVRVQHILHEELSQAMHDYAAAGAVGVVSDIRTGEVTAMVSLPDFDPNDPTNDPDDARFNRATLGVYEMGSTFKIFTTAMALESKVATLDDTYDASNPIHVARFTINDYHPQSRWLSVPEIFIYSSNIGAAKMALDVGAERQQAYLRRLGLLEPAHIQLPEVGAPQLPSPWRELSTMTIGYGHGLSVSPLQMASAVATVMDDGIAHDPTLLRVSPDARPQGRRVLSDSTSDALRRLMRLNVVDGTGKKAEEAGYLVGGKTGTAEKSSNGGYNRKALLSSFVAAFPMDEPRYVVLVMFDEPKASAETSGFATGGWTAAPVAGRVIARMAPVVGVSPIDEDAPEIQAQMAVDVGARGRRLASY
jgi:cell division protein FtsI (penicillin-binding protein 3)